MTEHRAQVEELLADYRRSRERLAATQQELGAVSGSASSADGLVTATVGARGVLTDLVIDDDAYARYRPAELAAHVVRAAREAAAEASGAAGAVLAEALGPGTDPQTVLRGSADLAPGELAARQAPDDADDPEEIFEDQNWLDDTEWSTSR
ncbi:YbaB/EbfC family nucleoid-associated protein [Saccharomonospora piscinae]|uniref:YbaB/EbfC family nucleoid-associated protein n=1 Tax=Saccharomonospora piscinae TaxID=687388 RepID=UPI00046760FB|nr:YbaB/EbfC family nucleoid-associated protein [Saccharomonospora piscinae]